MLHLEFNITRRHIYALVAAIAVIVTMVPLASYAADRFNDVPDSNIFHDDISWLADAGVTLGCNPAEGNTEFCPGDNVRRETMAAFMHRLAVNQVVDAKTAIDAEDSDLLDGMDSTAFLGATEKAADSDMLDGLDSTDITDRLPVAQALIDNDATATVERGFGITGGSRIGTGVYCLELDPTLGLSEADIIVSVTVDWFASSGDDLFAQWSSSSFSSCGADEFMVRTFDNAAGINESNDVRFNVIVFRADPAGTGTPASTSASGGNGS